MSERDRRRRDVAANLGSLRAEGLEPDEDTLADLELYVAGELTVEEGLARAYAQLGYRRSSTCPTPPESQAARPKPWLVVPLVLGLLASRVVLA